MSSILDELDAKHTADAQEKRDTGLVRIEHRGGQPFVYMAFSEAGRNGGWGSYFGPFSNDDEAQAFMDAGSFIANYRTGHGIWKVGYRVRYTGKTVGGHKLYVEDCAIGTEAEIIGDNGFDYRYTLKFAEPTLMVGEYVHETWRTGGYGWQRIA